MTEDIQIKSNLLEIYLHEELNRLWGIKAGDIWTVTCGKKQARVRLREGTFPLPQEMPVITITPGLARDLHLPVGIDLNVTAEENILRLGPLAGILTGPFNSQTHPGGQVQIPGQTWSNRNDRQFLRERRTPFSKPDPGLLFTAAYRPYISRLYPPHSAVFFVQIDFQYI